LAYSHNVVFYLNTPSDDTYKTAILVTWAGIRRGANAPGDKQQGQRKLPTKLTLFNKKKYSFLKKIKLLSQIKEIH